MNELPVMPIRAKYADESALGENIDSVFAELRGDVEDLEEAVVAKGFVGTATIVMPSGFALSELPTEVGFYKVSSAYQGYQGIMYVQTVGEHTNGFGMCANGKYYSFNDSVDLTMKDSFEFTGVVEVSQTGPSSYGITIPQAAGTYLVKAGGYTPKGAGILHSRDNGGSVRTIHGITVEGEIYSIYSATVGQTYNLSLTSLIAKPIYYHPITIVGGENYIGRLMFVILDNQSTAYTKTTFIAKAKELMDAGAVLQCNGYVVDSANSRLVNVYLCIKSDGNYVVEGNDTTTGGYQLPFDDVVGHLFSDGVNRIN